MKYGKERILLVFLVLVLFVLNYSFIDSFLERNFSEDFIQVERVVDGDTVIVEGNSMRLLGINTPEKGERYYLEAKEFLEKLVLNKSLKIEKHGKDKYYRELVYLFDEGNINLKMIEEGYANYYFPEGKEKYYDNFVDAWENCNKNLCERSLDVCANCVVLKNFGYGKNVILKNICDFNCELSGWSIKDEGRKKFVFEDFILNSGEEIEISTEDFGNDYVWTASGDTLFLRDNFGKLVLWEGY